jgi:hypothetical protein
MRLAKAARACLLFTGILLTCVNVLLAQNAYDRGTPAAAKAGILGPSSYAPDKIETVNLANGNYNVQIPLVTIGGAGHGGSSSNPCLSG